MSGQNTIRMLSIDDKTLTTDLDRAGYRKMGVFVKAAANYEEAEAYLVKGNIDLIVINMDYSGVDAVQVTKHLKAQPTYAEIPCVLTSVQTSAKVRKAALEAGADLFVEQPLPRQYFIEKLKQLLEQKTRETERVEIAGDVDVKFDGGEARWPIGDLSVSGVLLTADRSLPDGTMVELTFNLDGFKKPLVIKGEVVRTIVASEDQPNRKPGIGIRFVEFKGDSQKRLERYIAKSSDKDNRMIYYL